MRSLTSAGSGASAERSASNDSVAVFESGPSVSAS
jgi:hypothetical protein